MKRNFIILCIVLSILVMGLFAATRSAVNPLTAEKNFLPQVGMRAGQAYFSAASVSGSLSKGSIGPGSKPASLAHVWPHSPDVKVAIPSEAESLLAKEKFSAATGLLAEFPVEFRCSMIMDLEGRLYMLHGFDPTSGNRMVAYGLRGTATDAQIMEYIAETAGLSEAAMDLFEEMGSLEFKSASGLGSGRIFGATEPESGHAIKAVLVKTLAGDRTYLLGLSANPTYYSGNEDRIDQILSGMSVRK